MSLANPGIVQRSISANSAAVFAIVAGATGADTGADGVETISVLPGEVVTAASALVFCP